uniref:Uncharacterized protein n=1 Tax=Hemiselmis andersenii TaxID=464988 RepID=A0A6U4Q1H3_HEMAN|mmetsp:Transcript_12836/g.29882  ORF Transcript_12836/g.29882 Transcript_12836/m.29882 type:complete len:127 (+) Transcript_12836:96-476(+)|eukprot:CAMPEP_0114118996 /NCGR_PEP_ID=MMETSP0043_2-20121206/5878_1 /TAXON_ID=464988 /ORGANISM="Hemiselmis andersenii, Strain CCMP644" /LENGTH=126 /DNA_ID=CAMNT_0001211519 /DNA_START=97 /DNA_END=477 /DNA_ORIENTATION=-
MSLASGFSRLSLSVRSAVRSSSLSSNPALSAAVPSVWGARLASTKAPKKKADADPSKPKKQPNEWARFVKAHHAPTMKAYTLDFPTTIRALSMKWKDMGDAEKAVYQNEQSASKLELSPELLRRLP